MIKCDEIKIQLPEYIDGILDEKTSVLISDHMKNCDSCRKLYSEMKSFLQFTDSFPEIEPPEGMKEEFLKLATLEKRNRVRFLPFWAKIAATVLIVLGTFVAGYFSGSKTREIKLLNSELINLKQEALLAGLRDYSGPQKIAAVYNIKNYGVVDDQLVNALVYTMNSDNNVNVRLAAINALSEMMDKNPKIKSDLIQSLSIQDNPLLQISLIQVLTESGIKEAKDEIESIANNENTNQLVREYAKDKNNHINGNGYLMPANTVSKN